MLSFEAANRGSGEEAMQTTQKRGSRETQQAGDGNAPCSLNPTSRNALSASNPVRLFRLAHASQPGLAQRPWTDPTLAASRSTGVTKNAKGQELLELPTGGKNLCKKNRSKRRCTAQPAALRHKSQLPSEAHRRHPPCAIESSATHRSATLLQIQGFPCYPLEEKSSTFGVPIQREAFPCSSIKGERVCFLCFFLGGGGPTTTMVLSLVSLKTGAPSKKRTTHQPMELAWTHPKSHPISMRLHPKREDPTCWAPKLRALFSFFFFFSEAGRKELGPQRKISENKGENKGELMENKGEQTGKQKKCETSGPFFAW